MMSRLALPPAVVTGLAWALMIATLVWSVGALARIRAIMGLGDFMFLAALLVTAFGLPGRRSSPVCVAMHQRNV